MRSIIDIMKKHMMWIVELFVWGLIIFTALFIGIYFHNADVRKNYTYYVFFKDVDGLIKGSPVKLQGYQVGYVSNISIINNEVFVTFVITDKSFEMPKKMIMSLRYNPIDINRGEFIEVKRAKIVSKNRIFCELHSQIKVMR